ncbi:MAG: DEAD/DEAH box helicase [Gammaproteobacteria bacterium]|nr:DEAD/DEAH box helicase [Gammaproteobacteria bacterium]
MFEQKSENQEMTYLSELLDPHSRVQALAKIRDGSKDSDIMRVAVREADAIKPLVQLLLDEDENVRTITCQALINLSLNIENNNAILIEAQKISMNSEFIGEVYLRELKAICTLQGTAHTIKKLLLTPKSNAINDQVIRNVKNSIRMISNISHYYCDAFSTLFFWEIFIPGLMLVNVEKDIRQLISNLIDERSLPEDLKRRYIYDLLSEVITSSSSNASMLSALKVCSSGNQYIDSYIVSDDRIDKLLINSINHGALLKQASCDHFKIYAHIICNIIGENKERLITVLKAINFHDQNGHSLAKIIYQTFMDRTPNKVAVKLFIGALVESFQIEYFKSPIVVCDELEESTVAILDEYLEGTGLVALVKGAERRYNFFLSSASFLSIPFLLFSQLGKCLSDELTWYRMMYWLGAKDNAAEILSICSRHQLDFQAYRTFFKKLLDLLENLYRFFDNHNDDYQKIYFFVSEKIIEATRLSNGKILKALMNKFENIFSPLLDIDKDHLHIVLKAPGKMGDYENSFAAIYAAFESSFSGHNTEKWDTRSLPDKVLFLYCFVKFPLEEYRGWFVSENPQYEAYIEQQFSQVSSFKEKLPGLDSISEIGFKVLQNNQLAALISTINPPNQAKKVFARVGTGQGKSLIAALTALYHASQNRRVLVVTCYQHLAARDFKKFKPLFDKYNIKSQLISADSSSTQAEITYTELNTYFNALRQQVRNKVSQADLTENDFDFFSPTVLVLDEIDSLVEDAESFGNTVFDCREILNFPVINECHFDSAEAFQAVLSTRPEFLSFLNALKRHNLISIYEDWFAKVRSDSRVGSEGYDQLGKKHRYLGGARYELLQGRCYLASIYISVLAFLTSATFEYIVGFSGTIDSKTVERYKGIYTDAAFFIIPPFYGLQQKSTQISYTLSERLCKNAWIRRITSDVDLALNKQQPILVFADITNRDEWNLVKALLENLLEDTVDSREEKLIIIDSEKSIDSHILMSACRPRALTLASHVVGLGTDFVLTREAVMKGGMHILITYAPKTEGRLDTKMLEQMIGRGGRIGQPASYSVIVNNNVPVLEEEAVLTISEHASQYHQLIRDSYNIIKHDNRNPEMWRKWLLFNLWISHTKHFPRELSNTASSSADFVVYDLLQAPRRSLEFNAAPETFQLSSEHNRVDNAFITVNIKIGVRKKAVLILKYLNAIMINWLIFFYTLPQYAIYLRFTDDSVNSKVVSDCIGETGNFLLSFKFCSTEEMFRINDAGNAHLIQDSVDCLPTYLTGASVQLADYHAYTGYVLPQESQLSFYTLGLQGFTNCYISILLLPALFSIEILAVQNKLKRQASAINQTTFLANAFLNFLQYYFVIESVTFGPINQMISEERCHSLYTPNNKLSTAISVVSLSLVITSGLVLFCILSSMLSARNFRSSFELLTFACRSSLIIGGLSVGVYNALSALDLPIRLPESVFSRRLSFYNGGAPKIFSLILLVEHFLSTFDVPRFFKKDILPLLFWKTQQTQVPVPADDPESEDALRRV